MKIKPEKYRAASKAEIQKAEDELGVAFPKDYRNFLLKYDGAVPEENALGDDISVSVDRFISVAELSKRTSGVEGFPKNAWAVAECPSGDFIYIEKSSQYVFFWDHEIDKDRKIASSFGEFLKALKPHDVNSVQLKPGQVKSVWVDPDFKPQFD